MTCGLPLRQIQWESRLEQRIGFGRFHKQLKIINEVKADATKYTPVMWSIYQGAPLYMPHRQGKVAAESVWSFQATA